ncbi:hypothetical protein FN846DRAFT_889809 [Sphaerosporella brunnea]|uniref:Uncharacterized protein n=1 Tax=Sphaerosporella brunnea TaxID=1250544 RepID=A0A5J5EY10_9PEZI|nr:hypothetical protein FN846DRAFT_889809 [Sphaerosporella brunnea]
MLTFLRLCRLHNSSCPCMKANSAASRTWYSHLIHGAYGAGWWGILKLEDQSAVPETLLKPTPTSDQQKGSRHSTYRCCWKRFQVSFWVPADSANNALSAQRKPDETLKIHYICREHGQERAVQSVHTHQLSSPAMSGIISVRTGSLKNIWHKFPPLPRWGTAIIVMTITFLTAFAIARAYTEDSCSSFCARIPGAAYEQQCAEVAAAGECASGLHVGVIVHPKGCGEHGAPSFKFLPANILTTEHMGKNSTPATIPTIHDFASPTLGNILALVERASESYPTPTPSTDPSILSAIVPVTTIERQPGVVPWTPFPSGTAGLNPMTTPSATASSCTDDSIATFNCRCPFTPPTPLPRIRRSLSDPPAEGVPLDRSAGVSNGMSTTIAAVLVVVAVLGCVGFVAGWFLLKRWNPNKKEPAQSERV